MRAMIHKIVAEALITTELIKHQNDIEIQKCIDKYWDACRFPRKKKKQMRKEAQADYIFWTSLQGTINEFF